MGSRPWVVAAVGVLPALLYGVIVMAICDAPSTMPIINVVAALLGFGLLVGAGSTLRAWLTNHTLPLALWILLLLGLTLASSGLEGVRRWVSLGPVRLHISSFLAPVLLLCIAQLAQTERWTFVVLLVALVQGLHLLQPDAGQATAFAIGAMLIAARAPTPTRYVERGLTALTACVGLVLAWARPDPLSGVAMVEDIIPKAFEFNVFAGVGALVALAFLPGVAGWASRGAQAAPDARHPLRKLQGEALAVYFIAAIVVVFIGEFPTPVLGHGASPVLGAILGLGLLHHVVDP